MCRNFSKINLHLLTGGLYIPFLILYKIIFPELTKKNKPILNSIYRVNISFFFKLCRN
jgi:hypothetical protein